MGIIRSIIQMVNTEPQMGIIRSIQSRKWGLSSLRPEGLDLNFTRQMTGKTRLVITYKFRFRVFSRHKQMSSPSGVG